jgi:hypothetical protein
MACTFAFMPITFAATPTSAKTPVPRSADFSSIPVTENREADLINSLNNSSVQLGLKALKDNLPLIAAKHFATAYEKNSDDWTEDQTNLIRSFLGEALIRSGNYDKGTEILEQCTATPSNKYWTAVGLLNQGKYSTALGQLVSIDPTVSPEWQPYILQAQALIAVRLHDQPLLEQSLRNLVKLQVGELSSKAAIWLADICIQNNNKEEAATLLAPYVQSEATDPTVQKLKRYAEIVTSFLKASEGKWEEAQKLLQTITGDKKVPQKLQDLARVSSSLLEIARENSDSISIQENGETAPSNSDDDDTTGLGEDQLLAFIATRADSSLLTDAFLALIRERTFLNNADALVKLTKWAQGTDSYRQPLAAYALGTVLEAKDDVDTMVDLTRNTLKKTPFSEASESLLLRTLYLLLRHNQVEQAESLLKEFPSQTSVARLYEAGRVAYENQDFLKAQSLFESVIHRASDNLFSAALYNANLTALELGDGTALPSLLKQAEGNKELRERMAYDQAHYSAQRMNPQAIRSLQQAIAENPHGTYSHALRLDLAEVYLNQAPALIEQAQEILNTLAEDKDLTDNEKTRLARLQIILPERQGLYADAIVAARRALKANSTSPSADRIQLKLGELLFKNGQYNEALLVLQAFEQQYPYSDLNRAATFLAGKAAEQCNTNNSLETALGLFRQLADSPGQYSLVSHLEIASILSRTGKSEAAIKELAQLLLNVNNLPTHIRLQALSLLADAWAGLSGTNPEAMTKARDYCSMMLETPNIRLYWRFRALHQRAQYEEKLGDLDAALSDYASIMEYIPEPQSANKRDWFWFYTAGFSSLHISELRQDWASALAMADKLAKSKGPRAREAANIARRIRLEHFIWNEPGAEPTKATPLPVSSELPPNAVPLPKQPSSDTENSTPTVSES